MRAIHVVGKGGLDQLNPVDALDPGEPGPGQVRVELHGTSLNYHDYLVVTGFIPTPGNRIPMTDGGGVVTAVGSGVTDLAVGDHVVSHFFPHWEDGGPDQRLLHVIPGDSVDGYACAQIVIDARAFSRAPTGWTHAEAATLTCAGMTAWRAIVSEGQVKPGETVVVQGTGGVSVFALQFAKMAGARVIATSSSDAKLERMRALGADATINYRDTPEWGSIAREMAGGDGADHVVEIGGAGTLPESLKAVRNGGHISLIGVLAGFAGAVPTAEIMMRQVRLIGITVGNRRQLRDMVRGVEASGIRPVIDRSFPLENIADAFRHQETGTHLGKIVLEW